MTPLEHLRFFLASTPLHWTEHFNPEKQTSIISVTGTEYTTIYLFGKDQRLLNTGTAAHGQEQVPDNVPALKPELPFGGAWPQLPDWWKEQ